MVMGHKLRERDILLVLPHALLMETSLYSIFAGFSRYLCFHLKERGAPGSVFGVAVTALQESHRGVVARRGCDCSNIDLSKNSSLRVLTWRVMETERESGREGERGGGGGEGNG